MNIGRKRSLEEKKRIREELDRVVSYNERELATMQRQGWSGLSEEQQHILNNFVCVAVETMRLCPPAYVKVAAHNVEALADKIRLENEAVIKAALEKGKAESEKEETNVES